VQTWKVCLVKPANQFFFHSCKVAKADFLNLNKL
jgi:hypothetical protein